MSKYLDPIKKKLELSLFDRLTEKSHQVIIYAEHETRRLGLRDVCTTQILLGLITQKTGLATQILTDAGIDLEKARLEVEKIQKPGVWKNKEISFNKHTILVFELSAVEAEQLKDSEIDTHHLLLGLLKQSEGGAIRVLQNLGVDSTQLRIQVFRKLVAQGHPTASEFLPTSIPTNSDETTRMKSQLDLIQELIQFPEGSLTEVVKSHTGIINGELIEGVASILEQQGDAKTAEYLRELVAPVSKENIETTDNLLETPVNISESVEISTPLAGQVDEPESIELPLPPEQVKSTVDIPTSSIQDLEKFLYQLLRVSFESQANEQVVHSFFRENLEKLSDRFPEVLQNWSNKTLTRVGDAKKKEFLERVTAISSLIRTFDGGVRGTNLEIALTGYSIVASFLTPAETPEDWAIIHNYLGLTYLERVQGERGENLKEAIDDFTIALDYYKIEQFPDQRKIILENVKQAETKLRNMLGKEEEEKEEQKIASSSNFSPLDTKEQTITNEKPERSQNYLYLIEELLRSLQSQHESILDDNSELLDAGLIEMMRQRVEAEKNMGNIQNAELLNSIADRLNETLILSFSSNLDQDKKELSSSDDLKQPETKQKIFELPEAQQIVLVDIFRNIEQYGKNTEIIYPILQKYLPQFNLEFAENLRRLATVKFYKNSTQDAYCIADLLVSFSDLMLYFPLGDKAVNIAIVRAGYERSLTFFTREKFPEAYAELMINLGIAVEEDTLADSVQKWEDAIAYYQIASEIFTREVDPEKWASIQDNLGNAYRNRQQGEIEINLQQAIAFYQDALQIFHPERYPKQWGCVQHNLGHAYLNLSTLNIKESREDNEQFLEVAIDCYEKALQTLKKDIYPDLWALIQLSSGNAYSRRLRGNLYHNYEKAQQYFENALLVYTPQTYPFYYQRVKDGEQELQKLVQLWSESDSNIEIQEDFSFIIELLKFTLASQGDAQKVFAFLDNNLDKINQKFSDTFLTFLASIRSKDKNTFPYFMGAILGFSLLLMVFPRGERRININVAIIGLKSVLESIPKDKNLQQDSESLFQLGSIQLYLGAALYERYENRWGNFLQDLEETIKCFEEGFAVFSYKNSPEREWWASCQNKLGNVYFKKSEIKGDSNDLEKAINAYESALKVYPEETLNWAMVQLNLGNSYCVRQGKPLENLTKAIKCYKNSLIVYKQETYSTEWANVQISFAQAYYHRGLLGHSQNAEDIEQAIECSKRALRVYDHSSKYPERWAQLQQNLGVFYSDRRKGKYADNIELAIDYFNQSLTLITKEAYPDQWARIQKTLGGVYGQRKEGGRGDSITNLKLGIECVEKALQIFDPEKYPVDWAETQHNLASLYKRLAGVIDQEDNLKKAIDCANKADSQFRNNPLKWAKSQFELGTSYKDLSVLVEENREENLAKAIECYENALGETSLKNQPFYWAEIKNSLGNAYQHNGQYQEAINSYQDALLVHTRDTFPTDYVKTLVNIGNTHKNYQKLTGAFNSYQEAIDIFEDLLYQLGSDDDAKRKLGEEWVKLYQLMVVVCLKLGKEKPEYYATAWEYVERSKTRRLVEIFAQTKPADVSDTDWQEFQDLRNQITNEQKWIEDKEKSIILLGESVEKLELDNRKIIFTNLKQDLNKKLEMTPKLASRKKVQYTPFSKLGEKLSDNYTVIIQWYILEADKKFCAFIYHRQSFQPYVWESNFKDLENLRQWYTEYFLTYQDFLLDYVTNLKKLEQWIDKLPERLNRLAEILHIDKLLKYIPKNCQQVILIPHRFLHLFPIHALPIQLETWQKFHPNSGNANRTNYLFECFSKGVRYAPSCQTLLMLEKHKRPNFEQLLAVGNPTQDSDLAELCVKTVDQFWKQQKPQSKPTILCKDQATKGALINQLQKDNNQSVHTFLYSGHGSFELGSPLDSGLILNDNRLELTEIFGLDLHECRLVTLIACEAAMTDAGSITDEYIGLPSAFLWAGVSGIISALWTVEQSASIFLGIKLYQNLLNQHQEEKDVIKALNKAQSWLRNVTKSELWDWIEDNKLPLPSKQEDDLKQYLDNINDDDRPYDQPYYWAAFCVIGK